MGFSKNLMDFSDCVLVEIFKYLKPTDYYNLSRVNTRLETLMSDILLWKKIDARAEKIDKKKNDFCLERFNDFTKVFCIRGSLTNSPFRKFTKNLKILALENQVLDGKKFTVNNFPKSLEELSFRNSKILYSLEFFRRTSEQMVNLKVLLLDGCEFLNCSVVLSLSKYPNLRILSFYKCAVGNSIPYFSIAAWHGFKKVEVLDVRLSGLGNSFLRSMIRCPRLHRLYFQNMDTSYAWDLRKNREENRKQSKRRKEYDVKQDFQMTEINEESWITDGGTFELKRMVGEVTDGEKEWGESYLYEDPYGVCRCDGQGISELNDVDALLLEHRYPVQEIRRQNDDDDDVDDAAYQTHDRSTNKRRRQQFDDREATSNKRKLINDATTSSSSSGIEDPKSKRKRNESPGNLLFGGTGVDVVSPSPPIAPGNSNVTVNFSNPGPSSSVSHSNNVSDCDDDPDKEGSIVITVDLEQNNAVRNLNYGFNGFEILNLDGEARPAPISTLRRLSFRGHSTITDAVLPNLERLGLELLDVTHTDVTALGLEAFRKTNPQCRILHMNYCVCRPLNPE